MSVKIIAIGNEGFEVVTGSKRLFIDSFFTPAPWVGSAPVRSPDAIRAADMILVTHDHHDHFDREQVADVARRTGAMVIGPSRVVAKLSNRLPPSRVMAMNPDTQAGEDRVASCGVNPIPGVFIKAFRTFHGQEHNSYLVDVDGFRLFHDGDNEDTRPLRETALGRIDALFMGPWQGSGWVDFIDNAAPRKWFLMHLTEEELEQQAAGIFLPGLCDHVPANLVTLRPGESYTFT